MTTAKRVAKRKPRTAGKKAGRVEKAPKKRAGAKPSPAVSVKAFAPAGPAPAGKSDTIPRLCRIVASYGIVPNPIPSTIVGPAVPSMGQFTLDVNQEFDRRYKVLKPAWTINQTGYYIDHNP